MKLAAAILKYFPFGGLQRDLMRTAAEAHGRGHEVTIYTTSWEGEKPEWLTVRILNPFALSNHGKAELFFRELHCALEKEHCDVLFGMSRGPGLDVYFAGDECFLRKQSRKYPEWFCRISPRIRTFSAMERSIFDPAEKTEILCLAERQMKEYQECYGTQTERMHLIPPGMNPECRYPSDGAVRRRRFREEKGISEDRIVLLCVGANLKLKGADRVMEAAGALPGELRDRITVLLVGEKNGELANLADRIPAEIRFEGPSSEILNYYLGSDLMVHPARSEAAGSVIIEAISAGLPVICTELCGFSTYVRDSGAGAVLTGDFSPEALLTELKRFLLNREELKSAGGKALEYASHTNLTGRAPAVVDLLEKYAHGTR